MRGLLHICTKVILRLLSRKVEIADQTQEESFKENEIEIEQRTYKEVSDIITKLKHNKAPVQTIYLRKYLSMEVRY